MFDSISCDNVITDDDIKYISDQISGNLKIIISLSLDFGW